MWYRPKKKKVVKGKVVKRGPSPAAGGAAPAPLGGFIIPDAGWRSIATAGLGMSKLMPAAGGDDAGGEEDGDGGGLIGLEELDWEDVDQGGGAAKQPRAEQEARKQKPAAKKGGGENDRKAPRGRPPAAAPDDEDTAALLADGWTMVEGDEWPVRGPGFPLAA